MRAEQKRDESRADAKAEAVAKARRQKLAEFRAMNVDKRETEFLGMRVPL